MNQSVDVADKAGKSILKKLDVRAGAMAIAAAIGININSIAESVARFVIGFSKDIEAALEETVRATGKAADAQERQLEAARAKFQKDANDRIDNRSREHDMVAKYLADERKLAEEKAADELKAIQDQGVAEDVEWYKQQARIEAAKKLKLAQIEEVKAAELVASEEAARVEEARIKEKFKSMIDQWTGFTQLITSTGRGDRELSDRELERKIANLRQDIFQRTTASNLASASIGGGVGGYDPLLGAQQSNLQQTLAEVNLRRNVRQRAGALGEDAAFAQFSGLTEQRFREILQGIDTTSTGKLASAIDKLNQRLDQPLQTISLDRPTPFG